MNATGHKTNDLKKRIAYHEHAATNPYSNLDACDMEQFKNKAEQLKSELAKLAK